MFKFGWDGRRLAAAKPRALLSVLSLLDKIVLAIPIADATSQVCRLVRAYHKRHRILQPMAVKAFLVGEMRNGSVTVQPTVVPLELMVVDELKHRTYMRRGCRHTSPQFRQICS